MAGKVTTSHFEILWQRQKGRCWVCGSAMSANPDDDDYGATIEHVLPKAHGGTSQRSNLRLSHRRCNALRGAPAPTLPANTERPSHSSVIADAYRRLSQPVEA